MTMRLRRRAWLTMVLTAVIAIAACSSGGDGGSALPARTLERLDGTELQLADYAGRPLVINFFANWCPPCVTEMPAFEQVFQDYGGDVAFLGVSVQETVEEAQALVERTGVTYDLARDPQGGLVEELGGVGMPTTVFVDASGNVVESHTGELSAEELTDMIEAELSA